MAKRKKSIEEQRRELELQLKELEIAELQEELLQAKKGMIASSREEEQEEKARRQKRTGRFARLKDGVTHLNDYDRNEENIKNGKYEKGSIIYLFRNVLIVITQSIIWFGQTFERSLKRFDERINGRKDSDNTASIDSEEKE